MNVVCRCGGETALRQRIDFGSRRVVRQCQERSCGRVFGVPPRELRELDGELLRDLPMIQRKTKRQPNSRKRAYQAALKSAHWRELRKIVGERSRGKCEAKRPGCTGAYEHLGHRTYERLGAEVPEDVQAECAACSSDERTQRITRGVLGG